MQRRMLVVAISVLTAVPPAYASQKGPKGTHQPSTTHAQSAHPTGGQAKATKPPTPVKASKPATKASTKVTTKVAAKPVTKGTTKASTKATTKETSRTGHATTSSTNTGTTSTVALSPVQQKLQRNTNLAAKLQGRLPAGTDLTTASAGFRNLGQFVAAVNVSNNLGLSFTDLKTRMVAEHMSLGQAIQDLRPGTDTQTIARRAEIDADTTIRSTETATTTKTKTKSKVKTRSTGGGN